MNDDNKPTVVAPGEPATDTPQTPPAVETPAEVPGETPPKAGTPESLGPNYVGASNIPDRSNIHTEDIYPGVGVSNSQVETTSAAEAVVADANSKLREALVLIAGSASSLSFFLLPYFIRIGWLAGLISAVLAAAAIYFAIKDFNKTKTTSPLNVIGLSAATVTLVYIANNLIIRAILQSQYSLYN
jgi:hypothetical protein